MAGNVWEYVADWHHEDYYSRSPDSNPPGPASGDYRVVRGGSWGFIQAWTRSAARNGPYPVGTGIADVGGFRCGVS